MIDDKTERTADLCVASLEREKGREKTFFNVPTFTVTVWICRSIYGCCTSDAGGGRVEEIRARGGRERCEGVVLVRASLAEVMT